MPTWIGGSGALAAAWYAYQTITSQRQQIGEQQEFIAEQTRFMDEQRQNLELERAELRASAEDRRVAQARQVRMVDTLVPVGTEGAALRSAEVVNGSSASVRNLEVRFGTAHVAAEVYEAFGSQDRGPLALGERWVTPLSLLGSGRAAVFRSQSWSETTAYNSRPTLFFTDGSGVRWSLDSYGKLEEVPADGAP
ncbi:hypothetical protein RM704_10555 [Streptomyces sp. DSM 3412]|uniref:Uncharacterized protein n=1 Tax=Streptomyces gottesmaniae TaxID=3075518 RepID=A0ABU2YUC7_9ACTN|nr:hypothetical protein [Streptomyces sp. DSM 3412]MDT0567905.1 hypothetical protein [Streptomyces sp. DSM 3412]